MLALLARLRGSASVSTPDIPAGKDLKTADTLLSESEIDIEARKALVAAATEVDSQLGKLEDLLHNPPRYTSQDEAVIKDAISQYEAEVKGMERRLMELQAAYIQDTQDCDALLESVDRLLSAAPSTPTHSLMRNNEYSEKSSIYNPNRFATPLRKAAQQTPPSGIKSRGIDFDAFPHTPTLEQLGLSKAVLDLVGDRRAPLKSNPLLVGLIAVVSSGLSDAENDYKSRNAFDSSSGSISSNLTRFNLFLIFCDDVAPRMTLLNSSSSNVSNFQLATRLSDLSVTAPHLHPKANPMSPQMSCKLLHLTPLSTNESIATPIINNKGLGSNSPFGDGSSTIYGGRPSDTFSYNLGSETL